MKLYTYVFSNLSRLNATFSIMEPEQIFHIPLDNKVLIIFPSLNFVQPKESLNSYLRSKNGPKFSFWLHAMSSYFC